MKKTRSAGGVVICNGRVLIVNNGTSWSLAKGHVKLGESLEQAARREIEEESGIPQDKLKKHFMFSPYQRYRNGQNGDEDKDELKTIYLFWFTTDHYKLAPQDPKIKEALFVDIGSACNKLTHPRDREFLRSIRHQLVEKKD